MDLDNVRGISILLAVVFVVLMLLTAMTHRTFFALAAIAVIIADGVVMFKFWKCPSCGKPIGVMWAKYCPHCGEWLV